MSTTTERIYNLTPDRPYLPESVLEQPAGTSSPFRVCRDVGAGDFPSIQALRGDHRRGRGGHSEARGNPGRIPRAVPRRRGIPPVLDGADELPPAGRQGRLRRRAPGPQKAVKEARKVGTVQVAATTSRRASTESAAVGLKLDRPPPTCTSRPQNTIYGTEWGYDPQTGCRPARGRRVLRRLQPADRRLPRRPHLRGRAEEPGPGRRHAGHLCARTSSPGPDGLPTMLDYRTHAENKSLYNTAAVFPIYIVGLVAKWMLAGRGTRGHGPAQRAESEEALRDAIDGSPGFYRPHAKPDSRSN